MNNSGLNILDPRIINYDKLVDQIYSSEKGLQELIKQIKSLEQGIGNLSSILEAEKDNTRKERIKEMLGDVANVATVIQAVTGIANIPELAGYAIEIIRLIFAK